MHDLTSILINLELTREEILEEADLLEKEGDGPKNRKIWLSLEGYTPDELRAAADELYPVAKPRIKTHAA